MKEKIIKIFETNFGVTIRDKSNIHYIDDSIRDFASAIDQLTKKNYMKFIEWKDGHTRYYEKRYVDVENENWYSISGGEETLEQIYQYWIDNIM